MEEDVTTGSGIVVPATALHWRFERSSGAGGQNVNKVASRAQLSVATDELTGPAEVLTRVRERVGATARVSAQTSRSQWRNRQLCIERLVALIDDAASVDERRVPTRVPRGARERRLTDKRRASERKRQRRTLDD